ncbi:lectin like domain-containing protein [uncultured Ruminococcus sp.]|uniref:lectin like domain-containing protein n=1 Tax=uncultured Ruminococcus sp. TaxID=165186 RepID=UPI00262B29A4|nr:lectin like domain-containing protein [uncultured Ruminococcus sp.]
MEKIHITTLLLAAAVTLSGCSSAGSSSESVTAETAAASETADTSAVPETTEASSAKKYDYVHGTEGYYCILDEMPDFKLEIQEYGTCWLYAASASMRTAAFKETGKNYPVVPMELLDNIYGDDKEEGFFVKEGENEKEIGGWQWMVTEKLTSGFGDLTIDSSVILDQTDREAIKANLRERGAVAIGTHDTDESKKGRFGEYYTMNDTTSEDFDHDVTIIGYDDHFPKDYFYEPASEDGAWVVYNSALDSGNLYYISYCTDMQYAISHKATDKYSEVLSYDAGNEQDRYIKTGDSTKTANVFHKSGKLAAVGTYNDFDKQDIRIEIYDSGFNDLLYSQDAVLGYHGYHTVDLDTPVDVNDFAVAITYSKGAPVEGETIDYGATDYVTKAESGQSYVRISCTDGQVDDWKDLTDSGIKQFLNIDFEPGNCCIKALFAK